MALLFTDGFDAYGTSVGSNVVPSGAYGRRGWTASSAPKVQTGRIDGYAISLGYNGALSKNIGGTEATKTLGVAVFLETGSYYNNDIIRLYDDGDIQLAIGYDDSGYLRIRRDSTLLEQSAIHIQKEKWHYLEITSTINNTTGSYDVRFNGVSIMSDTGVDTQTSANAYWSSVTMRGIGNWEVVHFDDLYVTDTTGSYNTGFLGTIHVETIFPDADVTKEWTTSTGTDHYALVDENPADDDTSYVEDNVSAERELFDLPALSASAITINGATSVVDARITDASTVDMNFVNDSNSTVTVSASQTVDSQSQARYEEIYEENPDTSTAWTKTTFEAAKFGFEVA